MGARAVFTDSFAYFSDPCRTGLLRLALMGYYVPGLMVACYSMFCECPILFVEGGFYLITFILY